MFDGDVMIQNKEAQKHRVLQGWSGGGAGRLKEVTNCGLGLY